MNKPMGYDEAQVLGEYKPLPAGGYVCVIKQVREQFSRNDRPMIVIALDIYDGEHKGYYEKSFRADTRADKKWGCNVYQLSEDDKGQCTRGFKTFITSVEKSNPGFQTVWGEGFCVAFKGKLVGGLFGREQYQKNDGNLAWSTKCVSFRSADSIRNGDFTVPQDKPLDGQSSVKPAMVQPTAANGYVEVEDDDLPF